jgi:hypothetical protein
MFTECRIYSLIERIAESVFCKSFVCFFFSEYFQRRNGIQIGTVVFLYALEEV